MRLKASRSIRQVWWGPVERQGCRLIYLGPVEADEGVDAAPSPSIIVRQQGVHILQAGEGQLVAGAVMLARITSLHAARSCGGLRQVLKRGPGRTCTEVTVLAHSKLIAWLAVSSYSGVAKGPRAVDGAVA